MVKKRLLDRARRQHQLQEGSTKKRSRTIFEDGHDDCDRNPFGDATNKSCFSSIASPSIDLRNEDCTSTLCVTNTNNSISSLPISDGKPREEITTMTAGRITPDTPEKSIVPLGNDTVSLLLPNMSSNPKSNDNDKTGSTKILATADDDEPLNSNETKNAIVFSLEEDETSSHSSNSDWSTMSLAEEDWSKLLLCLDDKEDSKTPIRADATKEEKNPSDEDSKPFLVEVAAKTQAKKPSREEENSRPILVEATASKEPKNPPSTKLNNSIEKQGDGERSNCLSPKEVHDKENNSNENNSRRKKRHARSVQKELAKLASHCVEGNHWAAVDGKRRKSSSSAPNARVGRRTRKSSSSLASTNEQPIPKALRSHCVEGNHWAAVEGKRRKSFSTRNARVGRRTRRSSSNSWAPTNEQPIPKELRSYNKAGSYWDTTSTAVCRTRRAKPSVAATLVASKASRKTPRKKRGPKPKAGVDAAVDDVDLTDTIRNYRKGKKSNESCTNTVGQTISQTHFINQLRKKSNESSTDTVAPNNLQQKKSNETDSTSDDDDNKEYDMLNLDLDSDECLFEEPKSTSTSRGVPSQGKSTSALRKLLYQDAKESSSSKGEEKNHDNIGQQPKSSLLSSISTTHEVPPIGKSTGTLKKLLNNRQGVENLCQEPLLPTPKDVDLTEGDVCVEKSFFGATSPSKGTECVWL